MKKTLVVMSSNGEVEFQTRRALLDAIRDGAQMVEQNGSSDVAIARNIALTQATHALLQDDSIDVVLMVDDDMVWTPDDAQAVVTLARSSGVAASGVCVAYNPFKDQKRPVAQLIQGSHLLAPWASGLAFLAIPRALLLSVADSSKGVTAGEISFLEFVQSRSRDGKWWPEDYCLCARLGGVQFAPVRIGHIKKVALYPEPEMVDEIMTAQRAFFHDDK